MEVQTRSEDGELRFFPTIRGAMDWANEHNDTVWKVSFSVNGERVRLVRYYARSTGHCFWVYEPIDINWIDDPDEPLFTNPTDPEAV